MRKIGSQGPQPKASTTETSATSSTSAEAPKTSIKDSESQAQTPDPAKVLSDQAKTQRKSDKQMSGIMHRIAVEKHTPPNKPLPPTPQAAKLIASGTTTSISARKAPANMVLDFGVSAKVDHKYDGAIVGVDAQGKRVAWSAKTDITKVDGVKPNNGKPATGKCIYVNGMNTKLESQAKSMQVIANATGQEVVGIHNATDGFLKDGIECIKDKMNIGNNGAHKTLTETIYNHVKTNPKEPLNLVCHSQGGIITSRALRDVKNRLRLEDGMSKQQATDALKNIRVQSAAAAAVRYPSGPQYLHHVNTKDPVPQLFGAAMMSPDSGKHGPVNRFSTGSKVHSINDTYAQHLVPFQNMSQAMQSLG